MIKKILILTYILTILGISGLAKAASITVDNYSYDSRLLKLSISGQISQRCDHKLSAKVVGTESSGEGLVVLVEVVNQNSVKSCGLVSDQVSLYDMVLDIRSIGIPAGSNFQLKFANFNTENLSPLTINLPASDVDHSLNQSFYQGQIVMLGNGDFALLTTDMKTLFVKSTIDLTKYVGMNVQISGIEFVHQVGPIVEVNALDPLSAETQNNNLSMFVLTISTI